MRSEQPAFADSAVEAKFACYPAAVRDRLLQLRALIFATAATEGVGALEEVLKWGQPSYLTSRTRSGSTIRIDQVRDQPGRCAVHVHCQTRLVETFRTLYPDVLTFAGNRSILLDADAGLPVDALRHCIALALTYHRTTARRAGKEPRMASMPIRATPQACAAHLTALAADEARHTVLISLLAAASEASGQQVRLWSLGRPGECAAQMGGGRIALGDLSHAQCVRLAEDVQGRPFQGVVGPDRTAEWFAARAIALGIGFTEPMPQQILALTAPPAYPGAEGAPRPLAECEAGLVAGWSAAFVRDAMPDDRPVPRQTMRAWLADDRFLVWAVAGRPVSMAAIVRRTPHAAAISHVYTPPSERGRGYAGSVTAALSERIFAEGRTTACLYVDRRNPAANRCYARIGFRPICDAQFYTRRPAPT